MSNCDKVEEVDLEKSIVSKITDAIHEVGFRMAGNQFELEVFAQIVLYPQFVESRSIDVARQGLYRSVNSLRPFIVCHAYLVGFRSITISRGRGG